MMQEITQAIHGSGGWRRNAMIRYLLYGTVFGCLFPVVATVARIALSQLPFTLSSFVLVQRNDPLLWIIDTAPVFLGTLASIAGRRQDQLKRLNDELLVQKNELDRAQATLERRVEERTSELEKANKQTSHRAAQLQAITELSESIGQLQDLNEMFPAVTQLISERFGFYHVGVFLVDSDRQYAILQAANSEGGKRMLARSHRLELGTGVVGFAAKTGKPRIALDVGMDAVFFNNPDLPETRSEVGLPLVARGETIGVLDVQSTQAGAFSNEDLQVLTTLANQVSIALENARLLTETRAALAQVQEVYNEFTRAEWSRTVSRAEQPGFRYQTGRIELLENALQSPEVVSAVQNRQVVANSGNGSKEKRASVAVPVKLRGEVIGVLHIQSNDPSKTWQGDEISLVEAVAERAAFAMENARLFQEARRRAAKEQLISEATSRISSAFNLENILQTTAEELERVLGGSEVLIQFQSKESA
jgi:GAF domain-containing protein